MTTISQNQIIENLIQQNTPQETQSAAPNDEMGKDAFLKLLVTQLKHQDPLNPMEGIEFTQQLAQFTSLEQLFEMNDSFSAVNLALQAQNNFSAVNLVGRSVRAEGNSLYVDEGAVSGGLINLEGAANVSIHIFSETGEKVQTINKGQLQAGVHEVDWNGMNSLGGSAPEGEYTFEVAATDVSGNPVNVNTEVKGRVDGVTFDHQTGVPTMLISGLEIPMTDLLEVVSGQDAAAAQTAGSGAGSDEPAADGEDAGAGDA